MAFAVYRKSVLAWLRTPAAAVTVISAVLLLVNAVFSFTVAASQDRDVSLIKFRKGQGGDWRGNDPVFMFSKASEDLDTFRSRLPDEEAVNKTLSAIYAEGKRLGLKITKGTYKSDTIKKARISRYVVTLPVEGGYAHIKRFIAYLDATSEMVVIEDMALTKGSASGSVITIQLSLSAYYR